MHLEAHPWDTTELGIQVPMDIGNANNFHEEA